jgi:hypothetical protein
VPPEDISPHSPGYVLAPDPRRLPVPAAQQMDAAGRFSNPLFAADSGRSRRRPTKLVDPDSIAGANQCYSLLGPGQEAVVPVAGSARMGRSVRIGRRAPHLARVLRARISAASTDGLPVRLRLTARILRICARWIVVLSRERADRVGVCVLTGLAVVGSCGSLLCVIAVPSHLTCGCGTRNQTGGDCSCKCRNRQQCQQ